jgi:DNA-binding SARP family transcriptional activator
VLRHLESIEGQGADLWFRLLLVLALGEGGQHEQAYAAVCKLSADMGKRSYNLFLVAAHFYRAALAGRAGEAAERDAVLRQGWALLEAGEDHYVPALPPTVLHDAVAGALRMGLAEQSAAQVLRRQLPDQATTLLIELLDSSENSVRIRAAGLLGDLGAASSYPALRTLLKDRNVEVRQAAESALGRLVYSPPYQLRVRTLGTFGVWRGDAEVRDRDWRSVKARQLLQLLLIERGRLMPRERILDALWPELESEAAANNLRVTLSRLYKALEPERPDGAPSHYIQQHGETYGFNTASNYTLDAAEFSDAVAAGRRAEQQGNAEQAIAAYRYAITLYNGTFLPDSLYEDWSVIERERLGLLFNLAALRLGELLLEEGQVHEAIGLAWRALENDEAQEEVYRLLMRAHAALGERSTALRLYQRCVKTLREELGVEPLPETVELYEALRKSPGELPQTLGS